MLRKKTVVLAVAGALGAPVAAYAQNVQIYGTLYPELANSKATGGTTAGTATSTLVTPPAVNRDFKSRLSVDSSNSRIGFRGTEDLGGGMKAIWQIEQRARVDGDGTSGFGGNRDSFVGLSGGFGTVRLGEFDTVFKQIGDQGKFLGVSSGNIVSNSNVLARGPFTGVDFHLRQPNSVEYFTPSFGGVEIGIGYGPDENRYAAAAGGPSINSKNAQLISYGARWTRGPLYLGLAREEHKDFFGYSNSSNVAHANGGLGTTTHSKDTATRGTVMYDFGTVSISFDLAQLQLKETGGAAGGFESFKNRRATASAQANLGPMTYAIAYTKANEGSCSLTGGAACSTDGLDSSQFNLGAMLNLSRRTGVFLIGSKLKNGEASSNNNLGPITATIGQDTTAYAAGIKHTF